jgi:hypothetical protein
LSPQIKFEAGVDWWQQYRMERTKAILEITQIMNEKRLPRAKQRNPDREWQGREEGNELEQLGWLYMLKVQEDTLVWVETQKQK